MSLKNNFDQFVREAIENYSPEVSPHIWENIVAERKKRKPAGFWFSMLTGKKEMLLGAILLISIGAFTIHHFLNIDSNKNINDNSLHALNTPLSEVHQTNNPSERTGNSSKPINNKGLQATETSALKNETSIGNKNSNQQSTVSTQTNLNKFHQHTAVNDQVKHNSSNQLLANISEANHIVNNKSKKINNDKTASDQHRTLSSNFRVKASIKNGEQDGGNQLQTVQKGSEPVQEISAKVAALLAK